MGTKVLILAEMVTLSYIAQIWLQAEKKSYVSALKKNYINLKITHCGINKSAVVSNKILPLSLRDEAYSLWVEACVADSGFRAECCGLCPVQNFLAAEKYTTNFCWMSRPTAEKEKAKMCSITSPNFMIYQNFKAPKIGTLCKMKINQNAMIRKCHKPVFYS